MPVRARLERPCCSSARDPGRDGASAHAQEIGEGEVAVRVLGAGGEEVRGGGRKEANYQNLNARRRSAELSRRMERDSVDARTRVRCVVWCGSGREGVVVLLPSGAGRAEDEEREQPCKVDIRERALDKPNELLHLPFNP